MIRASNPPRTTPARSPELLIRAGYEGSAQVEKTMRWLLSMRQNDGGWAIPSRTLDLPLKAMLTARETLEPDRHPT